MKDVVYDVFLNDLQKRITDLKEQELRAKIAAEQEAAAAARGFLGRFM